MSRLRDPFSIDYADYDVVCAYALELAKSSGIDMLVQWYAKGDSYNIRHVGRGVAKDCVPVYQTQVN